MAAREEERRRIRRGLHDGLGPALAGIMFGLDAARNTLAADRTACRGHNRPRRPGRPRPRQRKSRPVRAPAAAHRPCPAAPVRLPCAPYWPGRLRGGKAGCRKSPRSTRLSQLSWHRGSAAVHTVSMTARFDELRSLDLFGGLTDQQLSELVAGSSEVGARPGVELFREGEHADFWWVLLNGVVELTRQAGGEETVVARMDVPGRWAGGFAPGMTRSSTWPPAAPRPPRGCCGYRPGCCVSG